MSKQQSTVPDIFRRAQALYEENQNLGRKEMRAKLLAEFDGSPMPPLKNLTIPEQDARAPEEDWTAGLSIIGRGIQNENWKDIIDGILMSLDQTVRYERERGELGTTDEWHDRTAGIKEQLDKGVGKWMPEELMRLAEKASTRKP
jgi:hypothetical protein